MASNGKKSRRKKIIIFSVLGVVLIALGVIVFMGSKKEPIIVVQVEKVQARTITQALNTGTVSVVLQAAQEANQLIDRRVFSWTDLFNRFEDTLPENVRVSAVEPQIDRDGRMLLAVTVIARRVEDLNEFMDQLELSGGVRDVIARQDEILEDGTLRALIQGYYVPPAASVPTADPPAASESLETTANASPGAPPETPRGDSR